MKRQFIVACITLLYIVMLLTPISVLAEYAKDKTVPFRDEVTLHHKYVECGEWSDWEIVPNPDGETSWCAVSFLCIYLGLDDFGTEYEEAKRSRICTSEKSGYTYVEWDYVHRRTGGFCNCLL